MPTLSCHQVAHIAKASYRQVDYWARMDVLVPSVEEAHGSGTRRRYSSDDARAACVVADLARLGATAPVLALAARAVQADTRGRLTGRRLVTVEGEVVALSDPRDGYVVNFDSANERVRTALVRVLLPA